MARDSAQPTQRRGPRGCPGVQDAGQVDETGRQPDVGDVRLPDLIEPLNDQIGYQVRIAAQSMAGVGRHDKAPFELAQQGFLAHDAEHPLVVDDPASTLQLFGDAPIPIPGKGQHEVLDGRP